MVHRIYAAKTEINYTLQHDWGTKRSHEIDGYEGDQLHQDDQVKIK